MERVKKVKKRKPRSKYVCAARSIYCVVQYIKRNLSRTHIKIAGIVVWGKDDGVKQDRINIEIEKRKCIAKIVDILIRV